MERTQDVAAMLLAIVGLGLTASVLASDIELPADPTAVVLTLDFRSDRVPRVSDAPSLSIHADGRIVMPQTYVHIPAYEGRMSPAELDALLAFVVREQRFGEYDEKTVAAKRAAAPFDPLRPNTQHRTETVITVNLPGLEKSIAVVEPDLEAPIPEIVRFLAVERRLERVMSVTKLGGRDEAMQWLQLANERLAAEHPDAAPFEFEDLRSGTIRADGSVYVQFIRDESSEDAGANVAISMTAFGEQQIAVSRRER
ncbi:MAG: hypothetical protein AAGE01_17555 [Pseudomonadota bacterium]